MTVKKRSRRMRILITNDDGIYSEGIMALYVRLSRVGDVTVVAPDSEKSAVGHGITMAEPLRVKRAYRRKRFFGHAVSGTPADCVKIGVMSLMKKKPHVVVSGINLGPNVGFSALYSGTVSGATEGAILGIPSVALSLGTFSDPDFSAAARFAGKIVLKIGREGLPRGIFLSVNVPSRPIKRIKGVAITSQGISPMIEHFDRRVDPRKHTYYWLTGEALNMKGAKESDSLSLQRGWITVTPLHYDLTRHDFIRALREWKLTV